MKKHIKIVLIILLLISFMLPLTYSYAIDKIQEDSFFEVSNTQVTKTENIKMIINLEKIKYNKFIFELKSDEDISNIDVSEEQVEIEKNNNEIVMEIDKQSNQLKNIELTYTIPDEKEVGDKIKFIATITNCENEKETESIETEIEIIEKQETEEPEDNKNEENTDKPGDNKNQETTDKLENNVEYNKEQENNSSKTGQQINRSNINSNVGNMQKVASTVTTRSGQNVIETVTYNGSNNNYLSDLSIENYRLNKEFTKENSTYFIEVENDVNTLNITATADDDTGTVCIYGNEDLEQGSNKILISVTAENGNVRNYRVYVTKKA